MAMLACLRSPAPAALTAVALVGCATVPFQPNVPQGGRAVAIAVAPNDTQRMLVASETGGLFRTRDGGATWRHVRRLPSYVVNDIAYAPADPDVVIATAYVDYKTANNGCIWRSTDGGRTWSQPVGAIPAAGSRCGTRVSAYSVSFEPGSSRVYVGTDCGLAMSSDLGATWSHVVPDTAVPVNAERTQNRVWSVLAQTGGRLNLAADDGLWFSTTGGTMWNRATSGPAGGQPGVNHAFAASPYDPSHLFHAGRWQQLHISTDGGATWSFVESGTWNRPVFVRAARSVSGLPNQLDVYFGNGVDLRRRTYIHGAGGLVAAGGWTTLAVDHADPADVGFHPNGTTPILVATDGGVHRTGDGGSTWTLTGGGRGGFNALQITEVTGQQVQGANPHLDLYFGTQDNGNLASSDGGATWPTNLCCEGFYIRTQPVAIDHAGSKVTGVTCAGCMNYVTDAHYAGFAGWPNAPDGDSVAGDVEGNAFLIRPGHYIQNTINNDVTPLVNTFKLTPDTGASWSTAFTIAPELRGVPFVGGPSSNPTLYHPVRRPGLTSSGHERIGLVKVKGLFSLGGPTVMDADGPGFGGLGIFPTMFAWYVVLGVDPHDPDHLLMADIETDEMKVSFDGGQTWQVDANLTGLVTGGGTFRFRDGPFPLVHAIAFDPHNRCHVLVGTAQNGVFRSLDGGQSWTRVRRSERITNLSSFYFPPTGSVIASSYGRGLWTLHGQRWTRCALLRPGLLEFSPVTIVDPATGVHIPVRDIGDPEVCPVCQYIVVLGGRVTNLKLDGRQVREIVVSGGSVHQFASRDREVPLDIPNSYVSALGNFAGDERLLALARQRPIRGLVIEGNTLRGVILSEDELPVKSGRIPYVRTLSADMAGGVPRVEAGGHLTVAGEGFAPRAPVSVSLDGEIVARNVPVDADGRFRIEVAVQRMPGEYQVTVEQVDGKRLTRDRSTVKVVTRDEPKERRPAGAAPAPRPSP